MQIEWLLIGGPADGRKVTISYGGTVMCADDNGNYWQYQGQNYLHRGQLYRIGFVDANDAEPSRVSRMIDETELCPIDSC